MKPQRSKPALFVKKGGEISLPGPILIDLIQSVLRKGFPFRFQTKGYSMHPFIKDGDVVTVSLLSTSPARFGDVAAFIHPRLGKLVVHRVFGKEGNSFRIKGDNIFDADGFIPAANILGRVTAVERKGKKVTFGLGPERILIAFLTRKGRIYNSLFPMGTRSPYHKAVSV